MYKSACKLSLRHISSINFVMLGSSKLELLLNLRFTSLLAFGEHAKQSRKVEVEEWRNMVRFGVGN